MILLPAALFLLSVPLGALSLGLLVWSIWKYPIGSPEPRWVFPVGVTSAAAGFLLSLSATIISTTSLLA